MPDHFDSDQLLDSGSKIIVAVGSEAAACDVVQAGENLAAALRVRWEAVHVETPDKLSPHASAAVAEALELAAISGAAIATVPAATVADGISSHLQASSADILVMGFGKPKRRLARRSILEKIGRLRPDVRIHLVRTGDVDQSREGRLGINAPIKSYGYAALSVAVTLMLAVALNWSTGVRFLSVLFLFPVIAAAAQLGTKPALLAALLSALAFNFFFLDPIHEFDPRSIQSLLMGAVLVIVALYTGTLTARLRGRLALSERSAQEHARLAAFALELTRVSDWAETAHLICHEVSETFGVRCVLIREVAERLEIAAAVPPQAMLEPLDWAALHWAWSRASVEDGAPSELTAANWRFQLLNTSLGKLGVLGLAREDGRDPVPPGRRVLLSTLIAQAALSLERLRLDDLMRSAAR